MSQYLHWIDVLAGRAEDEVGVAAAVEQQDHLCPASTVAQQVLEALREQVDAAGGMRLRPQVDELDVGHARPRTRRGSERRW